MLRGDLTCVQCGYQLTGISITGACPECSTLVRTTILAVVDPMASELRPIRLPWLTAAGLVTWTGSFLLAGLLTVAMVLLEAFVRLGIGTGGTWSPGGGAWAAEWSRLGGVLVAGLILLGMLGAAAIVRPHEGVPRVHVLMGWVGVLMHLPLAWLAGILGHLSAQGVAQPGARGAAGAGGPAYGGMAMDLGLWDPWTERTEMRLLACGAGILIIALLRPAGRLLVARSLALRTGRVDRQTMLATGAAVAAIALGDAVMLLGGSGLMGAGPAEIVQIAGAAIVIVGGVLVMAGLIGSWTDCVRIARAIVRPSPTLGQVLEGHAHGGKG